MFNNILKFSLAERKKLLLEEQNAKIVISIVLMVVLLSGLIQFNRLL